jgi:hypothetical protein
MHHIVMFSGGKGSYLTAKRVVAAHGAENVTLLFADTLIEDEGVYQFLSDTTRVLGAELVTISDGRTPWELFEDTRFIGNTRVDICSRVLKRDLLDRWIKEHFQPEEVVVYVGIDWTEVHRFERLAPRKLPYIYKAPLCEPPFYDGPEEMLAEIFLDGIEIPRLYKLGFAHNNCGGFCVKSGHAQFKILLEELPDRFAHHEEREEHLRRVIGKDVAILRDRRGGKTRPMTLKEFRERLEVEGQLAPDETHDFGGCGCALD